MTVIEIQDRSHGRPRYSYAVYIEVRQLISWTPHISQATQFTSVEEAEETAELYRQYLDDPAVQVSVLD